MKKLKLSLILLSLAIFIIGINSRRMMTRAIGQTGLMPPTGVIASDGSYNDQVGLNWDAVRGATSYRILRSTSGDPAAAVEVGNAVLPYFFDTTAVTGQQYFYWVQADNGSTRSGLGTADTGFRAAGTQQGPVPPLGLPFSPPQGNPTTAAKAVLGKVLFWDEQMSSTLTVSCGTCHQPARGGSDPRSVTAGAVNPGPDGIFHTPDDVAASPGVPLNRTDGLYEWSPAFGLATQVTPRKSPSVVNSAFSQLLFWDGRATGEFRDPITNTVVLSDGAGLESQAAAPPVNDVEMAHSGRDWNQAAAQITAAKPLQLSPNVPPGIRAWIDGRGYPELFQEAFGTPDVTPAKISMAIASYERTLYSDRAPIDLANAGIQPLTAQEQRGRSVFNLAQCNFCHVGQLLADNTFHNIGVRPANEDTGRFQVTNDPQNLGEFRTPSLRNVELRAPYMHNGRFATLEQVVDFYDRGGDFPNAPNFPADLIHPRGLTAQQKADLVAFLKRPLTDPRVAAESAPFDRPQLFSESGRVPVIVGQGTAGSGGSIPHPIAIEPPLSGNPSFTVAVTNVLAGAAGVLVIDSSDPGNTSNVPSAGSFARVNIQVSSGGNGAGYSSVSLQIPADRSLIGRTFFGRWYISDPGASNGVAVSPAFRFTIFGGSQSTARARHADFDGDGRTDLSVYRPSLGNWYIQQSSNNVMSAANFGLSNDVLAPEDFDGDGRTDIAVYRDGVWYIMRSRDGLQIVQWGLPGDVPQPGDYDGDGIADIAVWRPSDRIWYLLESRDGFRAGQFGLSTDRPVAADYDGDGKTDIAVYRDGIWYLQRSTEGWAAFQFGLAEDRTVAGDYDGDGKADAAVYRPSTGVWYVLKSSDGGFSAAQFGISTDVPSPGDYDGDGKFDLGVFRPSEGNWYVLLSQTGTARIEHWGMAGDLSVPASFVQ